LSRLSGHRTILTTWSATSSASPTSWAHSGKKHWKRSTTGINSSNTRNRCNASSGRCWEVRSRRPRSTLEPPERSNAPDTALKRSSTRAGRNSMSPRTCTCPRGARAGCLPSSARLAIRGMGRPTALTRSSFQTSRGKGTWSLLMIPSARARGSNTQVPALGDRGGPGGQASTSMPASALSCWALISPSTAPGMAFGGSTTC
jgi:hypothetical protein